MAKSHLKLVTPAIAWSPPASAVCKSPLSSEANGSLVFHSGFAEWQITEHTVAHQWNE
jgi:hypothetical protein